MIIGFKKEVLTLVSNYYTTFLKLKELEMKYDFLGKTGVKVSELCFGTMSFGGIADEKMSKAMFDSCRDAGALPLQAAPLRLLRYCDRIEVV